MRELRYEARKTLDAAPALLSGANGQARILAGGTALLLQMSAPKMLKALTGGQ